MCRGVEVDDEGAARDVGDGLGEGAAAGGGGENGGDARGAVVDVAFDVDAAVDGPGDDVVVDEDVGVFEDVVGADVIDDGAGRVGGGSTEKQPAPPKPTTTTTTTTTAATSTRAAARRTFMVVVLVGSATRVRHAGVSGGTTVDRPGFASGLPHADPDALWARRSKTAGAPALHFRRTSRQSLRHG